MMIKTIIFDADDTLWHNEAFFRENEEIYFDLLSRFKPRAELREDFFRKEMMDLPLYGYGVKAFILSMLEMYIGMTDSKDDLVYSDVKTILELGRTHLNEPVILLDDVEQVLKSLSKDFPLVIATKGDLLDQERKLRRSGIESYFHHIEIMSDKKLEDYIKLLSKLNLEASQVLIVGNSLKSDIVPVLELGGWGVHVPYVTTWEHEEYHDEINSDKFFTLNSIKELPLLLSNL